MLNSLGTICYRAESVVANVDKELVFYYQWLLKKSGIKFNVPLFDPHITIIRKHECEIIKTEFEGSVVPFRYYSGIKNDELYFWISVETNEIFEKIRLDNGLDWCYDKKKFYHITIGNLKGLI
jgi:hypothetical protein